MASIKCSSIHVYLLILFIHNLVRDNEGYEISRSTFNDRTKRQSAGSCKIPEPPANSIVKILGQESNAIPGTYTGSGSVLEYKCKPGYILAESTESPVVYQPCINGKLQEVLPVKCLPTCPVQVSKTAYLTCKNGGYTIPCDKPVPDGTVMTMECKNHYRKNVAVPDISTCKDGKWDTALISCTLICGVHSKAKPLIVGGSDTSIDLHPWHVGIYRKYNGKYNYICGGTLINAATVVSAASCYTDVQTFAVLPKEHYMIIAGKNYRDWDDKRDDLTKQERQVKQILVPNEYRGYTQAYTADIALIEIEDFILNNNVGPVCVDWDAKHSEDIENVATVVGWGVTELNGKLGDPRLNKLDVPIISREECEEKIPQDFQAFITKDKYCAGYFNGSSICTGDSGSGLITKDKHNIYTLRGIASTAPVKEGSCDTDQVATYTKISYYLDFIRKANEWIA